MPEGVQFETLELGGLLLSLLAQGGRCLPNCLRVLLLEAGRLDMPAPCPRGKDPLPTRRLGESHFQDCFHSRGHWNSAARVVCLAILNLQYPASDILRAQPKALLGPESAVQQNAYDIRKQRGVTVLIHCFRLGSSEVQRLL